MADETKNDAEQLTHEQAVALFDSGFWKTMTHREIAEFQMSQDRLCMPFDVFQDAFEKTVGRPVFTHEFANRERLTQELFGHRPQPTMQEIIEMIPAEKRIVIAV